MEDWQKECITYYEDTSTAISGLYPVGTYTSAKKLTGYYRDDNFVLPTSIQTVSGRFASTNRSGGVVKLRLSPREMKD